MKRYKQPKIHVCVVAPCLMNVVSSNLSDNLEYGGTGNPFTDQRSRRYSVWDEEEE